MKHYRIASLRVAMKTFGRTEEQARIYEIPVEAEPDFTISSNMEKMLTENHHLTADECEYISSGESFYTQILAHKGMMLHASCVVVDDKAYLFSAPSGTGKSTHTELWLKLFPNQAYILNDDKPALRFEDGVWYAYGTPWSGKNDINRNTRIPVAGIAFLERSKENSIEHLSGSNAITEILNQTLRPLHPFYRVCVLENLNNLISRVPIWKLKCNTDLSAAMVSYRAMAGVNKENKNEA